jgi:hypothetical protein
MAVLRLDVSETGQNALPDICVHCGMPAIRYKRQVFTWIPGWMFALIPVLGQFSHVLLSARRQMHVWLPVCEEHEKSGHAADKCNARRLLIVALGAVLICTAGIAISVHRFHEGTFTREEAENFAKITCFSAVAICSAGGLLVILIGHKSMLHPTEITPSSITLSGVSEVFARTVEERRHSPPAEIG